MLRVAAAVFVFVLTYSDRAESFVCDLSEATLTDYQPTSWGHVAEWILTADASLALPISTMETEAYAAFRAAYVEQVGTSDPMEPMLPVLDRYRALVETSSGKERERYETIVFNMESVVEGRIGTVDEISCLEWILYQMHLQTYPTVLQQVETQWYVLLGADTIVVVTGTIGFPAVFDQGEWARVQGYIQQGYELLSHVHNHPPGNPAGILVGPNVTPSASDITHYRTTGVPQAAVISGVGSARFSAEDFALFRVF